MPLFTKPQSLLSRQRGSQVGRSIASRAGVGRGPLWLIVAIGQLFTKAKASWAPRSFLGALCDKGLRCCH